MTISQPIPTRSPSTEKVGTLILTSLLEDLVPIVPLVASKLWSTCVVG